MVKLVMEDKDNNEEEEKLLPEEFKRWQERDPNRRPEGRSSPNKKDTSGTNQSLFIHRRYPSIDITIFDTIHFSSPQLCRTITFSFKVDILFLIFPTCPP